MTLNDGSQTREGPDINTLHHRLTEYPKEWLASPLPAYFIAVVHDAVFEHCTEVSASDLDPFRRPYQQCEWYRMSLLMAYFLADESFDAYQFPLNLLLRLFEETAKELTQAGSNNVYISDVDRREEFIRVVLSSLKLRPKGETGVQAEDRLQAVSSQERLKVLKASQAAEERAREIREALARQKAKEAADKMARE
ncbi:hypothetical protein BTA51_03765 [Hahella sp. CCB-MM4]|nr:hypothetical protein BTA51_03765 [Hahella sp. CCB-MM4]